MSETAVADTPGFEVLENVSGKAPELDRSPHGNGAELRTDVGHSSGEEGRNIVVSETTVRGHSLELEIEGELDYEEIEDTHLSAPNFKDGDKGNPEKTQQGPPRISWNEWAGNGDSQEAKPITEEQPKNEQQEHRRPREEYKHRRENSKRNSSRRYRESTGGRHRSPPVSTYKRPVVQNSGRRTGENETRSSGGNTGLRIPPGMSQQQHHHHRGKFPSVSQCQDSEGPNHHPVERGMPPGLGISRNQGPGNHPPPVENRGGHQWRTGPRFQQRSPPPGPRLDDRPPPRRDYVHPERIQQGRIRPLASHRSPPPSEVPSSTTRRTRSPGRGPGPLPYPERSFIARNSGRGRPPGPHGGHHRRNSGSPRLPNRVPASPRRVTLPANSVKVRGPSSAGMGQNQRNKNQNSHVIVQRRPPSPVDVRRSQFPHQPPPFRRPHTRQKQSPPSRRPPEYLDRPDRRSRGRNHHRSPSPGRSNKRQRANSQDRRFAMRAPPPHPLEPNSPPPPHHLTQSHSGADGRVRTPLHHPEMDCIWHYVDPQGNVQGPCTIQQFRSWLKTLAEDPQFVDEHRQFRGVSVWKDGMHERYSMTELLDRNVG